MINNFIMQKSDMIDLNTVENVNKLEKITTEILNSVKDSANPVKDTITAIENYNTNHKLPIDKRLTYWITINGNPILVHVFHTEMRTNFAEITYFIGSGAVDAKYDSNTSYGEARMSKANQGLMTIVVPYEQIFAVSFGSYNTETIDPIFNNPEGDQTKISNIENKLRTELEKLNTIKSTGNLKGYIIEFSRFMKQDGINSAINYNYNREAYNLYITLWKQYLLLVENIVDHFEADTVPNPEIGLFTDESGVETVDNYKKIIEDK